MLYIRRSLEIMAEIEDYEMYSTQAHEATGMYFKGGSSVALCHTTTPFGFGSTRVLRRKT